MIGPSKNLYHLNYTSKKMRFTPAGDFRVGFQNKMTPNSKAALKTACIFFGLFVLICLFGELFHLNKIIFDSFISDPEITHSKTWKGLIFLLTFICIGVTGILGYIIAKKKNRNDIIGQVYAFYLASGN